MNDRRTSNSKPGRQGWFEGAAFEERDAWGGLTIIKPECDRPSHPDCGALLAWIVLLQCLRSVLNSAF